MNTVKKIADNNCQQHACNYSVLQALEVGYCKNCRVKDCPASKYFNACPTCGRHMEYGVCRWTDCPSNIDR
jgi:hypothetical protein